ncbi:MAG: type II toxin-antitoxin system VapB family antitoxin [Armatimonadetes bacterium]|nr:type II toxin-antitoxin system VapB family antitoxin [Armatimonadota bacterium]
MCCRRSSSFRTEVSMRITVDIPDGLLEQAMALGGFGTKRAAAIAALEECIRRHSDPSGPSHRPGPASGSKSRQPRGASAGGCASADPQPAPHAPSTRRRRHVTT